MSENYIKNKKGMIYMKKIFGGKKWKKIMKKI